MKSNSPTPRNPGHLRVSIEVRAVHYLSSYIDRLHEWTGGVTRVTDVTGRRAAFA